MYLNSGRRNDRILLWGGPASLWTGRVRAYFIKKGIEYQEMRPAHPAYHQHVLPKLGYFAIPVTELEDGTLLRTDPDTLTAHPMLGEFTYESRGVTFHRQTFASALFCFQRALDEIGLLDGAGRERIDRTMADTGGANVVNATMRRRIRLEADQYSIA